MKSSSIKVWMLELTGGRGEAVGVCLDGTLNRLEKLLLVVPGRQMKLADVATRSMTVVFCSGF